MRCPCIKQTTCGRRGVVLVVVLACVAIISILLGTMIKSTLDWRRQVRYETWNSQAGWLAESGLRKAVHELNSNRKYAGEVWQLNEADGLLWPVSIDIKVTNKSQQKTINVVATFAEETGRPVRAHRTLIISASEDKTDD
jgi:type II secretory pathway component PulK